MKEILTAKELADRWNISTSTLETWRAQDTGPNYIKLGNNNGRVLYRIEDIEKYERSNTINPVSNDKK